MPAVMASATACYALVIVGHGTRDPAGRGEFARVAAMVAGQRPDMIVEAGFLELAEPDIPAAIDAAVARGAARVTVSPLLLFAAGHAKRDIPAAIDQARSRHPGVHFEQAPALESHPAILHLSADRWHAALAEPGALTAGESVMLLVGRGSHDREAVDGFLAFAQQRMSQTPAGALQPAFLAMAEPSLDAAIERAAAVGLPQVVVQPHLLFCGDLVDRIARCVERARQRWPATRWLLARPLGPDPLVALALAERAANLSGH